jgi:hypothetical protein
VTIFLGIAWYYILDDDDHPWPVWSPSTLFDIEDGALPAGWRVGNIRFSPEEQYTILSFPEWADDYYFYERLLERDSAAIDIFNRRRLEVEDLHAECRREEASP